MDDLGSGPSWDELVSSVIVGDLCVTDVVIGDGRRSPCENSARRVGEAFRQERLYGYELALLLKNIGHPIGFEILCGVFADPNARFGGGCVAEALLALDPRRAPEQLVRFVEHAATQGHRDEAARGLAQLGPASAAREALLRASAASHVSPEVAAPILVAWSIEPALVEKWLTSGVRSEADLACGVVAIGAWSSTCQWTEADRAHLLHSAQVAVTQGDADPKPYVRTGLRRPSNNSLLRMLGSKS